LGSTKTQAIKKIAKSSRGQVTKQASGSFAPAIYSLLLKQHPDATIALDFKNPLQLLIATILSAQCTDVKVNQVTPALFKRFRSASDFCEAKLSELETLIRQTGFFRQKSASIKNAAAMICEKHHGKVPQTMDELTALPGVGRKTANVVLGNAFGIPGLPVDTHVTRVSQRIGLTAESDPVKIEKDLCAQLEPPKWIMFSHLLIFHGRRICKARNPLCGECSVRENCAYFKSRGA
jgi:endonuclease III